MTAETQKGPEVPIPKESSAELAPHDEVQDDPVRDKAGEIAVRFYKEVGSDYSAERAQADYPLWKAIFYPQRTDEFDDPHWIPGAIATNKNPKKNPEDIDEEETYTVQLVGSGDTVNMTHDEVMTGLSHQRDAYNGPGRASDVVTKRVTQGAERVCRLLLQEGFDPKDVFLLGLTSANNQKNDIENDCGDGSRTVTLGTPMDMFPLGLREAVQCEDAEDAWRANPLKDATHGDVIGVFSREKLAPYIIDKDDKFGTVIVQVTDEQLEGARTQTYVKVTLENDAAANRRPTSVAVTRSDEGK